MLLVCSLEKYREIECLEREGNSPACGVPDGASPIPARTWNPLRHCTAVGGVWGRKGQRHRLFHQVVQCSPRTRRDWSNAPRTYSEVRTYRSTVTVGHPPLDSVEINSLGNTDDKHAFWPRLLAGAGLRDMCTWVLAALRSRAQLVACVHISHPREDRSPSRHVTPVH